MELHIIFFIIAVILLGILIGYSVWSIRREKSRLFSNNLSQRIEETAQSKLTIPPVFDSTPNVNLATENNIREEEVAQEVAQTLSNIKISLAPQAVNTAYAETQAPAQTPVVEVAHSPEENISIQAEGNTANIATQTLQMYVVAPEGAFFQGEFLVSKLEEAGLQYDHEYQIFQRHIDTAASPVIFGVANMMNPGVIDLNTLHRLNTQGLVLFMHTTKQSNDHANLHLMVQTAYYLAEQLGGFVWDEHFQPFTEQTMNAYLQRL